MKKRLLIALVAVTSMCSAYTHEYVPMIREDRVWQYGGPTYRLDYGIVYHSLKFDGSTITVNDKTYHTFTYFNSKFYAHDYETDEWLLHHENNYDGDGIKYFLREEPGKVFALSYMYHSDLYEKPIHYVYSTLRPSSDPLEELKDKYEYSECQIYDFSAPDKGEINIDLPQNSVLYEDHVSWIIEGNPATLNIDNEECRFLGVYPKLPDSDFSDSDSMRPTLDELHTAYALTWIEGIGILRNGCLADYYAGMITGTPDNSFSLYYESRLHSVYKTDGTVIFGEQPAGVGKVESGSLKVWRGVEGIRASGEGCVTLTVCGIDGVKYAEATGTDDVTVDTATLPRGIYVASAHANGEHRTRKIRL